MTVSWRVLRTSSDPKFMVKGFELADCFLALHRFRVEEVRAYPDGYEAGAGVRYCVFDADTVSDADVRAGKSPDAEVRVGRDSRGESEVNSKTVIPGGVDKRVPGVPGASGRGKKLEYPSLVSSRRPKKCSLPRGPGKKAFPEVGSEMIRTVQTKIRPTRI